MFKFTCTQDGIRLSDGGYLLAGSVIYVHRVSAAWAGKGTYEPAKPRPKQLEVATPKPSPEPKPEPPADPLAELRAEVERVTGKKPHHKTGEDKLRAMLEEATIA